MRENDDGTLHDGTLREAAQRLGGKTAERLDVERTAAAVIERLRREPKASGWSRMQPAWLRVAAAIVLLVGGVLVAREVLPTRGTNGHGAAHLVSDDLRDLSADQLREVLSTLDETLDLGRGRTTLPEAGLDELDAQQLRAVLRSLEG